MHVISKRPFIEASARHPNQREALMKLHRTLSNKSLCFQSPEDMRSMYPSLDNFRYMDRWWVLDIGGNHLRMIACILFQRNLIFVKHIITHAEYDRLCERYRRGELS